MVTAVSAASVRAGYLQDNSFARKQQATRHELIYRLLYKLGNICSLDTKDRRGGGFSGGRDGMPRTGEQAASVAGWIGRQGQEKGWLQWRKRCARKRSGVFLF